MTTDKPIKLHLSNGQFYIWDINDVKLIRKTYRIVGCFVGSTNWFGSSYQNKIHGLPLQLMIEECLFLLINCDNVKLVKQNLKKNENLIEKWIDEFREYENQFLIDYKEQFKLNSIEQINQKLDLIAENKAKKCNLSVNQIDRNQIFNEAIQKIKRIDEHNQPKQMLIQSLWSDSFEEVNKTEFVNELNDDLKAILTFDKSNLELKCQIDNKLTIKNEHSLLRFLVYKDLNDKALYLTKGNKFGSDFLAYPTDPLFCHALYLVICLNENQHLTKTLLHTYTRLGSQVNKNVLLVRFKTVKFEDKLKDQFRNSNGQFDSNKINDLDNQLEYMVIKWQSNN